MATLNSVSLLFVVSVLLQLLLAWLLIRRLGWRRRFHSLAAAVLVLNGAIAALVAWARVAGLGSGADSPHHAWIRALDFASVLLLLVLAIQWIRGLDEPWTRRDRAWLAPLVSFCVLHGFLVVNGGTWLDEPAARTWFLHVPTYGAYAALLVAGAHGLHRGWDVRVHAPLLVAFGMRGAQFGAVGLPHAVESIVHPAGPVHSFVAGLVVLLCFAAAALAVVVVGVAAWRRPETRTWGFVAIQLLVAGGAIGVASSQVTSRVPAYEATQLLSLVLVRPLGIGFALAPAAFGGALLGVGFGVGGAWVTRLLLALVTGGSVWALNVWWLPSLLAGTATAAGIRRWTFARAESLSAGEDIPGPEPLPPGPPTREVYGARLLDGLVEAYHRGRSATIQDLLRRAGIPRGSQTLAERGLAQVLGMDLDEFRAATAAGSVGGMLKVRNATRSSRGRPPREYALTEEGCRKAMDLLDGLPPDFDPSRLRPPARDGHHASDSTL